jgi:hypothetical protein
LNGSLDLADPCIAQTLKGSLLHSQALSTTMTRGSVNQPRGRAPKPCPHRISRSQITDIRQSPHHLRRYFRWQPRPSPLAAASWSGQVRRKCESTAMCQCSHSIGIRIRERFAGPRTSGRQSADSLGQRNRGRLPSDKRRRDRQPVNDRGRNSSRAAGRTCCRRLQHFCKRPQPHNDRATTFLGSAGATELAFASGRS